MLISNSLISYLKRILKYIKLIVKFSIICAKALKYAAVKEIKQSIVYNCLYK